MPGITITELSEDLTEDDVDVSRWQNYGKDRLYINRLSWTHDNCYVDLDGDEGHSTWAGASFDVDGDTVAIESTKSKGGHSEEQHRVVLEVN